MRLMLVWTMATTLPRIKVITQSRRNRLDQSAFNPPSPSTKTRRNAAKLAALEATAMNAVTEVGAPSYTSGVHIWNGTTASLKPNPAANRIVAIRSRGSSNPRVPIAPAIDASLVLPAMPYKREIPYSSSPEEKAPNTKYLAEASSERGDDRLRPAIT